jgi:hypothetical protein
VTVAEGALRSAEPRVGPKIPPMTVEADCVLELDGVAILQ